MLHCQVKTLSVCTSLSIKHCIIFLRYNYNNFVDKLFILQQSVSLGLYNYKKATLNIVTDLFS